MRYKNTIIMLFVLCSSCLAANKYVATDGSDANTGDSVGDAYATIQYALNNMGGSGTVYVAAGTYSTDTYYVIDGTHNGWNIEIEGATSEPCDTVLSMSSGSIGFRIDEVADGGYLTGNLSFKNVYIVSSGAITSAGLLRCESSVATTYQVILDNCVIGDYTGTQYLISFLDATGPSRNLIIRDSLLKGSGVLVSTSSCNDVNISNSYMYSKASGNYDLIICSGEFGSFYDNNNYYQDGGSASTSVSCVEMDSVTSGKVFRSTNSTFNITGNYRKGIHVPYFFNSIEINGDVLTFNVAANARPGISVGVDGTDNDTPYGLAVVQNNTVRYIGAAVSHAILLGTNYDTGGVLIPHGVAIAKNNYCEGGDYQIVSKHSINNTICGNVLYGATPIYLKGSRKTIVSNNTIWATTGNGITILTADGFDPNDNVIMGNIICADGADSCISIDVGSRQTKVDWNCYYNAADSNVFNNNGINYTSLDAIRAIWSGYNNIPYNNDAHSIIANPQFRNVAVRDFRLKNSSPCVNTGESTCSGYEYVGFTSYGADQPKKQQSTVFVGNSD